LYGFLLLNFELFVQLHGHKFFQYFFGQFWPIMIMIVVASVLLLVNRHFLKLLQHAMADLSPGY
jgi:hypothetical protein